jgi:hypothetical protein
VPSAAALAPGTRVIIIDAATGAVTEEDSARSGSDYRTTNHAPRRTSTMCKTVYHTLLTHANLVVICERSQKCLRNLSLLLSLSILSMAFGSPVNEVSRGIFYTICERSQKYVL